MRKFATFTAALAATFATFAALDFKGSQAIPALAPQTVSAGATNEAVIVAHGLKGGCEVFVTDAGAAGRTSLDVTLWATNSAGGGWRIYAAQTFTATNAAVRRVAFPGEYLPAAVKVGVGSIGAATPVSAFILSH